MISRREKAREQGRCTPPRTRTNPSDPPWNRTRARGTTPGHRDHDRAREQLPWRTRRQSFRLPWSTDRRGPGCSARVSGLAVNIYGPDLGSGHDLELELGRGRAPTGAAACQRMVTLRAFLSKGVGYRCCCSAPTPAAFRAATPLILRATHYERAAAPLYEARNQKR